MLAGQYIASARRLSYPAPFISEVIVFILVCVRLLRFSGLERVNLVLSAVSIVPTVLYFLFTIPHIDPSTWAESTGEFNCTQYDYSGAVFISDDDWSERNGMCRAPRNRGQLLAFALWSWSGFFNIGTLAGQINNPRKVFPVVLVILVIVVLSQTVLSLALSISVDQNLADYEVGNFARIAETVAGQWLSVVITIGAIFSQLGLAIGGSLICDEALQSFSTKHYPAFFEARRHSPIGPVKWLFDTHFRIAPIFVLFDGLLMAAFVWVPYELLVTASMLIFNVTASLVLGAYVMLKRRHPYKEWLYGKSSFRAVLLCCLPAAGSVVMSVYAIVDDYTALGIPHINLVSFSAILAFGWILHGTFAVAANNKAIRRTLRRVLRADAYEMLSLVEDRLDAVSQVSVGSEESRLIAMEADSAQLVTEV